MKDVLVTGANGHLGLNLVKLLLENGYRVKGVVKEGDPDFSKRPLRDLGVELIDADITKPDSLRNAFKDVDGVFQLAAVYSTHSKNPAKDIITPNVEGGLNVLKAAHNAGVSKIVYTSSIAAIGTSSPVDNSPLTEKDWNNDTYNPYFKAKTEGERKAWEFARENNLNLISINPGCLLGPGFYKHTPSTYPFELAIKNKIPFALPFGFSYVDVRDAAMAHILAYENSRAEGRYIISEGTYTMMEIMTMLHDIDSNIAVPKKVFPASKLQLLTCIDWVMSRLTGQPRQITRDLVKELGGKYQLASSQKAINGLNWKPMDIKISLQDTIEWIREVFIHQSVLTG